MPEVWKVGEGVGKSTGEEILREVEVAETPAGGDVEREGGVNGVVVEDKGGEILEVADDGGERSGEVGVGEVDGGDGAGGRVAGDTEPGAGCVVAVVPGEEGRVRIVQRVLDSLEVQTFLVQTQNRCRRREKSSEEEDHRNEKNHFFLKLLFFRFRSVF